MKNLKFKCWNCRVIVAHYDADRSVCLRLVTTGNPPSPVATATVCLAGQGLTPPPGYCFIKDYSENEGILEALTEAGIVSPTGEIVPVGFAHALLCKLLVE